MNTEQELQYEQAKRDLAILERAHEKSPTETHVLSVAARLVDIEQYHRLVKLQRDHVVSLGDKVIAEYQAQIDALEARVSGVSR